MPTFDGATKTITLDAPTAGVLNVDVQDDLYEEWKLWLQTDTANMKWAAAFRTIGGDPLTATVSAGSYFFLRNDFGWRIRSSDEDQTINYVGNLVGESSSLPIILNTPGRTVLHLGLQPVTQGVEGLEQISTNLIDVQTTVEGTDVKVDVLDDKVDAIGIDVTTIGADVDGLVTALTGVDAKVDIIDAIVDAIQAAVMGNADVSLDDLTVEIKDAGLAVIRTLSVSADGRVRRIVP